MIKQEVVEKELDDFYNDSEENSGKLKLLIDFEPDAYEYSGKDLTEVKAVKKKAEQIQIFKKTKKKDKDNLF